MKSILDSLSDWESARTAGVGLLGMAMWDSLVPHVIALLTVAILAHKAWREWFGKHRKKKDD